MLTIPDPLDPDDDGGVSPEVSAALAAYQAGTAGPERVLNALGGSRLLVPVVALLTSSEMGAHGVRQEKESEMALPKLVGKDGREAVLAFTGAAALRRWRADARPIQATTLQVCRAAVGEGAGAVVIDVAGPVPFVIEGEVLRALAAVESGTLDGLTVARVEPVRKRSWFRRKAARGR
ncbi:SseB family protein [Nonomuraea sp. CA-218870]|uniref:SseB family protein n=1 Tax=Nonomuraea corallina TaxID=2989783 RepID=A0ABT4S8F1_9ACTN|nr:SseB family protein [Nonomuraea corallina]MDA0633206.1 SseB family protein [Nonomuraea corallina]